MSITPITIYKYTKVSFGQFEKDTYHPKLLISDMEYNAKRDSINKRFDKMKSYILKTDNEIELRTGSLHNQLSNIEILRNIELSKLDAKYHKY